MQNRVKKPMRLSFHPLFSALYKVGASWITHSGRSHPIKIAYMEGEYARDEAQDLKPEKSKPTKGKIPLFTMPAKQAESETVELVP
jgi:hypothetical protein